MVMCLCACINASAYMSAAAGLLRVACTVRCFLFRLSLAMHISTFLNRTRKDLLNTRSSFCSAKGLTSKVSSQGPSEYTCTVQKKLSHPKVCRHLPCTAHSCRGGRTSCLCRVQLRQISVNRCIRCGSKKGSAQYAV